MIKIISQCNKINIVFTKDKNKKNRNFILKYSQLLKNKIKMLLKTMAENLRKSINNFPFMSRF